MIRYNQNRKLMGDKLKKTIHKDHEGDLKSKHLTQELVQEYQRSLDALANYKKDYAIRLKEISARELLDPYY